LQGGGSFGAFTWGFLDRLLEEDDVAIDVVSGASAGALNAVLLADGLAGGGNAGAREKLDHFWHRVAHASPHLPAGPGHPVGAAALFELSTRLASPYQLNPLGLNPMRHMLIDEVDFERLRAKSPVRLLIAATRVRDGRLRLFREDEVTVEAILASACLPYLHHAIEIDGEAYWDGGYSANPPLRQLVIDSDAKDVILVQLMPEEHGEVPHLSPDISRRMQEIAFTTSLHKELEALDDLREVCRQSRTSSPICRKLRELRFHRVVASDAVEGLEHESALDTRWSLIGRLKEHGRSAAEEWLAQNPPAHRTHARRAVP
jgi:NTE family protein